MPHAFSLYVMLTCGLTTEPNEKLTVQLRQLLKISTTVCALYARLWLMSLTYVAETICPALSRLHTPQTTMLRTAILHTMGAVQKFSIDTARTAFKQQKDTMHTVCTTPTCVSTLRYGHAVSIPVT